MNKERKYVSNFLWATFLLVAVLMISIPNFTRHFSDLRQKQETEENYQRELAQKRAIEKAKKDAELKMYLTGRFDPTKKEGFVLIPEKYTLGGLKMYTRKETYGAFLEMEKSALFDGIHLHIVSATRNFEYQKDLWNNKWTGVTFVDGKDLSKSIPEGRERFEKILEYSAVPSTSRHHWGTDIDINGVSPTYFDTAEGMKQYEWLKKNAPLFGFCQTYNLKGSLRATGYNEEKWHWSYLPLSVNFTEEYKRLVKDEDIKGFMGDEYVSEENLINNYVLSINPECI